jgi:large subunit ribosomal protein L15
VQIHQLKPAYGAGKKDKRIGRGPGSGHGKTSTKGHKGHLARAGGGKGPGFEGGQMPLIQRVPKRGFNNAFRESYSVVNLKDLNRFEAGEPVTPERMKKAGLAKSGRGKIKILGDGDLSKPLVVRAHRFSRSALEKIQKAKGSAEVLKASGRGAKET